MKSFFLLKGHFTRLIKKTKPFLIFESGFDLFNLPKVRAGLRAVRKLKTSDFTGSFLDLRFLTWKRWLLEISRTLVFLISPIHEILSFPG
jgi:hypothetical protein